MASTGFNQSGGAYYIVTKDLDSGATPSERFLFKLTSAGSKSGGAWEEPTLAEVRMNEVLGGSPLYDNATKAAPLVKAGALLKDMGKTVVSKGVTYRKFAPVVSLMNNEKNFGVVGAPGAAPNTGYGSFYLAVGREGSGAPAPIARYA